MLLLASNQLTFNSSANQIIADGSEDKETGYGTVQMKEIRNFITSSVD